MSDPITFTQFLKWKPPPMSVVLSDGLMYAGSKVILYGKYKAMKSMLALRFMLSCSTGDRWLGFSTPRDGLKVLYLQLEVPEPMLQDRLLVMTGGTEFEVKKEPVIWTEAFLKLDTEHGIAALDTQIAKHQPDIVVLDPLYKLLTGNISDGHHVSVFLDNADRLIAKHGISLMILSHGRKPMMQNANEKEWGSDDLLGTVLLSAWADSIIKVTRKKEGELRVDFDVVRHAKKDIKPIDLAVTKNLDFVRETNF